MFLYGFSLEKPHVVQMYGIAMTLTLIRVVVDGGVVVQHHPGQEFELEESHLGASSMITDSFHSVMSNLKTPDTPFRN